jgi:ribosomal protein S27E
MAAHDFRNEARAAIVRARELMRDGATLPSLRYAALEARMAMEALTYDRAQAYERDLPRSEIGTWQPRKLLLVLLDLDPLADSDRSLSVSKGPATGGPGDTEDVFDFGTEKVLNLKAVRQHYDAIGSRLHMPTIKQMDEGVTHDPEGLKVRLETLLSHLEEVVASPIFNMTMMGRNSQIDCMRCGFRIRKAVVEGTASSKARCPDCGLRYDLHANKAGDFDWWPERSKLKCANPSCPEELTVFRDELAAGALVPCKACGEETLIVFGGRRALPPDGEEPGPTLQLKDT